MYGHSELGQRCHWCGAYVHGNPPKTGNHLFCKNGGKCKMAHARAFAAYEKCRARVTAGPGPGGRIDELPGPKSNAKPSDQAATSSPAISLTAAKRSNARKRGRRR
jgi:hypothetical protein